MRTRYMWKYCVSSQGFGTPTVFVNGIHLNNNPGTVDEWMTLLNDVYAGQSNP
jgi:hypothetical protein